MERSTRLLRRFDQVNDASGEALAEIAAAQTDDAGLDQFLLENRQDRLAIGFVKRIQGVVDAYPARLVQQQAREGEALRFLACQFAVPIGVAIQLRRQSSEIDARTGGDQILV